MRRSTLDEAASLLNVSKEHLLQLIAAGRLAAVAGDEGPAIDSDALERFKAKREQGRRDGVRELTRMTEDFGGYDAERRR